MLPNKPLKLTAAGFSQSCGFSPTRHCGIIGGRSLAAIRWAAGRRLKRAAGRPIPKLMYWRRAWKLYLGLWLALRVADLSVRAAQTGAPIQYFEYVETLARGADTALAQRARLFLRLEIVGWILAVPFMVIFFWGVASR